MSELDAYVKSVSTTSKQVVETYRVEVQNVLDEVIGGETNDPFTIEDELDYVFAGEFLKHVKRQKASLEEAAKERAAPLKKALELVRELDGDVIVLWGKVEKFLKEKIGEYTLAKAKAQEALAAKVAEAAQSGDFDAAHEASRRLAAVPQVAVDGVSTREVWVVDWDNVDITKAPREALTLDVEWVKAYIKEFGKARPKDLPGIPFRKEIQVRGSKR